MSGLMSDSIAVILNRYKGETLAKSTPATQSKIFQAAASGRLSESTLGGNREEVGVLTQIVEEQRAALVKEDSKIQELERNAREATERNTVLTRQLDDLRSEFQVFKMNAMKLPGGEDQLQVRELVMQLFDDYKRATNEDVKQLNQLSKLALHDRGAFSGRNDVLDMIVRRVEAVEKDGTTYRQMAEERDSEVQQLVDRTWKQCGEVTEELRRHENSVEKLTRELRMTFVRRSALQQAKSAGLWRAALRTFRSLISGMQDEIKQLKADITHLSDGYIRLESSCKLAQDLAGRKAASELSSSAADANFKSETNERLVDVVSRLNQLQREVIALQESASSMKPHQQEALMPPAGFSAHYRSSPEHVRDVLSERVINADKATPDDSTPLQHSLSTDHEHDNRFPYCLDTGKQESQRLQRFDMAPINRALRTDVQLPSNSDLRRVLDQLQRFETEDAISKCPPTRTVEDILGQIDRLERRAAQKQIGALYDEEMDEI